MMPRCHCKAAEELVLREAEDQARKLMIEEFGEKMEELRTKIRFLEKETKPVVRTSANAAHLDGKPWFHNECDERCYGQCKQSYEFVEPNHPKTKKCKGWRCDGSGPAHHIEHQG